MVGSKIIQLWNAVLLSYVIWKRKGRVGVDNQRRWKVKVSCTKRKRKLLTSCVFLNFFSIGFRGISVFMTLVSWEENWVLENKIIFFSLILLQSSKVLNKLISSTIFSPLIQDHTKWCLILSSLSHTIMISCFRMWSTHTHTFSSDGLKRKLWWMKKDFPLSIF